jgi:hypothetical protein
MSHTIYAAKFEQSTKKTIRTVDENNSDRRQKSKKRVEPPWSLILKVKKQVPYFIAKYKYNPDRVYNIIETAIGHARSWVEMENWFQK